MLLVNLAVHSAAHCIYPTSGVAGPTDAAIISRSPSVSGIIDHRHQTILKVDRNYDGSLFKINSSGMIMISANALCPSPFACLVGNDEILCGLEVHVDHLLSTRIWSRWIYWNFINDNDHTYHLCDQ